MIIGAADSMRDAISVLFEQAGHRFQLLGGQTTAKTVSGHEIGMWRSQEIMKGLDSNVIDLAIIGSDIVIERNRRYRYLRRKPPELHRLGALPELGRQYGPLELQVVVHQDAFDSGINRIQENTVVLTEHPFTMRDLIAARGLRPVFVGRNGSPPEIDRFKIWEVEKNRETQLKIENHKQIKDKRLIVGIEEIDGKVPTALIHRLGDIGTIVSETGQTNFDNRLVILETVSKVHMLIIARQAYIDQNPQEHQAEVHRISREILDSYTRGRREFLSRTQIESQAGPHISRER